MSSTSFDGKFHFDIPESFTKQDYYRVLFIHQAHGGALNITSRCYNKRPDLSDILDIKDKNTPETDSGSWRDINTSYADYMVIQTAEVIGLREIREIRRGLNSDGKVVFTKIPPDTDQLYKMFIANGFQDLKQNDKNIVAFKLSAIACCGNIR